MNEKKPILNNIKFDFTHHSIYNKKKNSLYNNFNLKLLIILQSLCILLFFICLFDDKNIHLTLSEKKIHFDKYETTKFNGIKEKLDKNYCSEMWGNQREFLNGIIRFFKPIKILEIGVRRGGSSIIILNAISDFKESILFSIDISSEDNIGNCTKKYFPDLMKKWRLFKGNIATEFLEQIGNDIDMVLIDTAHFEPGEILDFLMVLPFLKENAIIIFHDIANQITKSVKRNEWAPYIIFNGIRGEKYLPSGNNILTHDIGAIKLETNQKVYYHDYFRLLGGQWQYYPKEIHINQLRKFFKKYYDNECSIMFEETISFNKIFVKNNPKNIIYKENSD